MVIEKFCFLISIPLGLSIGLLDLEQMEISDLEHMYYKPRVGGK